MDECGDRVKNGAPSMSTYARPARTITFLSSEISTGARLRNSPWKLMHIAERSSSYASIGDDNGQAQHVFPQQALDFLVERGWQRPMMNRDPKL